MLDALHRYAIDPKNKLVTEPGFKPKTAKWAIHLDSAGAFTGVLPIPESMIFKQCPELKVNNTAHPLLAETGTVVLFTDKDGDEPGEKLIAKHDFFVARLQEAGEYSPGFRAAAVALSNPDTVLQIRAGFRNQNQKAKAADRVTFFVDGVFPINLEDWHAWWRTRRVELINELTAKKATVGDMVCLVTGEVGPPLRVHPKITGLASVGGQPSGESLIGFDKSAFRSYGFEQSANAAMSEDAANAYRAALDDLLKKGERITGMKVAYWFSRPVPDERNPFLLVVKDSTRAWALGEAKKLLAWIQRGGSETPDVANSQYYALSLSGAAGRVMVRDWMTGAFENLARSVVDWFDHLNIAALDGEDVPSPALWRVISSALSPNETGDKGVGSIKIPLWKAALDSNRPIPDAAVIRVLHLHRAFIVTGELDNPKRKTPLSTLYIRMGLLKASLIRKGKPMESTVNPAYQSSAYHCGRLIAMLAALQRAALPDVDAGVAQRYYGAASVTPRLVVGRLTRLAQHHVAKVASSSKGLAYWYESRIGEIVTAINGSSKPLPATFSTQEQTEFALGYYQQIAENRTKKTNKSAGAPDVDPAPDTDISPAEGDATETN